MAKKISEVVFEFDSVYNAYADQLLVSNNVATILVESVDLGLLVIKLRIVSELFCPVYCNIKFL
jgi:hypothetical protein